MKAVLILYAAFAFSFSSQAAHDSKEIKCLATNIYHESRGEGLQGMAAVGQVTRNRVHSPRFSDSYCKVVYAPKQFTWTKHRNKKIEDKESWKVAMNVAKVTYYIGWPQDLVGNAIYFRSGREKLPKKHYKQVTKIGGHTFYVDRKKKS